MSNVQAAPSGFRTGPVRTGQRSAWPDREATDVPAERWPFRLGPTGSSASGPRHGRRLRRTAAAVVLVTLAVHGLHAQNDEPARPARSGTATCEVAGLVAVPPSGWVSVPFETPPPGHLGCVMMRVDGQQLLGILRIRSASGPSREFTEDAYDRLVANEIAALAAMNIMVDLERGPLWTRDTVPVAGAGFRDGRAVGLTARIKGNEVAQEAHVLVFRSDTSKYLVSLVTPTQARDGDLYRSNTNAMGVLVRTLQPSGVR
jgi:hypothetical protein